jgi:hypothetical protein
VWYWWNDWLFDWLSTESELKDESMWSYHRLWAPLKAVVNYRSILLVSRLGAFSEEVCSLSLRSYICTASDSFALLYTNHVYPHPNW